MTHLEDVALVREDRDVGRRVLLKVRKLLGETSCRRGHLSSGQGKRVEVRGGASAGEEREKERERGGKGRGSSQLPAVPLRYRQTDLHLVLKQTSAADSSCLGESPAT